MRDNAISFGPSLQGLESRLWLDEIRELVEYDGFFMDLGERHTAAFTEHGKTLLVTFETLQGISALSPSAHPLGWDMVKRLGWSHLGIFSDGDTWFRDPAVCAFFDRQVDDGFFDEFDRVVFFGSGPCAYAACAFSVTAPGAVVLALQPQATLAPQLTEWDRRFPRHMGFDFSGRYAYAPDMLEAAKVAYLIYDPNQIEDAMHASLFTRSNVTKLRARNMGSQLQLDFLQMGLQNDLIERAGTYGLSPTGFAHLLRARRDHLPYLRRLLVRLEADDRPELAVRLCRNVSGRLRAPLFEKRLESLKGELA